LSASFSAGVTLLLRCEAEVGERPVAVFVEGKLENLAVAQVRHVPSLAADGYTACFAATAPLGEYEYAFLINLAKLLGSDAKALLARRWPRTTRASATAPWRLSLRLDDREADMARPRSGQAIQDPRSLGWHGQSRKTEKTAR
jgi:hypothetical protein